MLTLIKIYIFIIQACPWNGLSLSPIGLTEQLNESRKGLYDLNGYKGPLDLFYLHSPDPNIPIEDTLEEVQKHYNNNKFKRFGLSNFTAWEGLSIFYYIFFFQSYIILYLNHTLY